MDTVLWCISARWETNGRVSDGAVKQTVLLNPSKLSFRMERRNLCSEYFQGNATSLRRLRRLGMTGQTVFPCSL